MPIGRSRFMSADIWPVPSRRSINRVASGLARTGEIHKGTATMTAPKQGWFTTVPPLGKIFLFSIVALVVIAGLIYVL